MSLPPTRPTVTPMGKAFGLPCALAIKCTREPSVSGRDITICARVGAQASPSAPAVFIRSTSTGPSHFALVPEGSVSHAETSWEKVAFTGWRLARAQNQLATPRGHGAGRCGGGDH